MFQLNFGILTVSDTCYRHDIQDTAGARVQLEVKKYFPSCCICCKIVPDELEDIKNTLIQWSSLNFHVILTIGGTGFSPRDVTPEATRAVIEKEAPGIAYAMISKSLGITDMAMLSRAVCGIKSKTLIINLPGSEKAAVECFEFIKKAIPHGVAVLIDNKDLVKSLHAELAVSVPANRDNVETQAKSKVKINPANRNRVSPYPMLEVDDAVSTIQIEIVPFREKELISFDKALNRILAEDIYAKEPIPPFRSSIKDGYAIKMSNFTARRYTRYTKFVRAASAAGDAPNIQPLQDEEAIRISTGAPVPSDANTVVAVEDTTLIEASEDGTQELKIEIIRQPTVGQDIRGIGSDIQKGELVLRKGERISAAHIGILAMLGTTQVWVIKRARVGIISTGNELKAPNDSLEPGQIRDGNKYVLMNLLKRYSYESSDCGTAKDDPDSVKFTLERALENNDLVITTGGVSMGEHDVVKQVLETDFDAMIHFGRVNMKPGKPTTFATLYYKNRPKTVFALPGNPVSCSVTSLLFVIPALRFLERCKNWQFPVIQASFPEATNTDERPEYHRVKITSKKGELIIKTTGNQISSRLNSMAGANGLAIVPKTDPKVKIDKYNIILFDDILCEI